MTTVRLCNVAIRVNNLAIPVNKVVIRVNNVAVSVRNDHRSSLQRGRFGLQQGHSSSQDGHSSSQDGHSGLHRGHFGLPFPAAALRVAYFDSQKRPAALRSSQSGLLMDETAWQWVAKINFAFIANHFLETVKRFPYSAR